MERDSKQPDYLTVTIVHVLLTFLLIAFIQCDMFWTVCAFLGTSSYIVIMIVPHTLIAIATRSGNIPHIIARYWARWTLLCSHVRIDVDGDDNIPAGPAVYMANHASYYDVLAILGYMNVQFRWTVKKELYRIPLLNLAMKGAGYIMIDRGHHARAMAAMKVAAEKIRSGTSVMIFPEGTRSEDGKIKYPFKKGGFHLAIQAGVPIVPIGITGSRPILPKGSFTVRPGRIYMSIGKPIFPQGKDVDTLMHEVYEAIKTNCKEDSNQS